MGFSPSGTKLKSSATTKKVTPGLRKGGCGYACRPSRPQNKEHGNHHAGPTCFQRQKLWIGAGIH